MPTSDQRKHPIDIAIDARRNQLRLRWKDIYDRSGVSQETLRKIRNGLRDDAQRTTDKEAQVEDALGWDRGSIQAIREGREPVVISDRPGRATSAPNPAREYPAEVAGDAFLRHIYDYAGEDASDLVRDAAIQGALLGRRMEAERLQQNDAQRA